MKKYHHITTGRAKSGDRIRTIPFGSSIKAVIAYPKGSKRTLKRAKRGKGKGRIISLRFSPRAYSLARAKSWAKSHSYKVLKTAKAGTTTHRKKKIKKKKSAKKKLKVKKGGGRRKVAAKK